jgi:hypothetical protein
VQQPALPFDRAEERRARVGRGDVEGGGRDALCDGPVHRPVEDVWPVTVESEHERAVDHHAQVIEPADGPCVVPPEVLPFVREPQRRVVQGLEANEQRSQAGVSGTLDQVAPQHAVDRCSGLPYPPHPAHTVEERRGEPPVAR